MTISKNKVRIMVTIPKEINELLKEKANKNQRSVSNYVFNLIMKDLKNKY